MHPLEGIAQNQPQRGVKSCPEEELRVKNFWQHQTKRDKSGGSAVDGGRLCNIKYITTCGWRIFQLSFWWQTFIHHVLLATLLHCPFRWYCSVLSISISVANGKKADLRSLRRLFQRSAKSPLIKSFSRALWNSQQDGSLRIWGATLVHTPSAFEANIPVQDHEVP